MKKIVIGGSRGIRYIAEPIRELLDNIIENNDVILIGDANGADKAVQKYLYAKQYKHVIVYCMHGICRNNIGQWPVESVLSTSKIRDANYYGTKDLHMALEADSGIMLWDGLSKGTFRNIINLLDADKQIHVYYQPFKCVSLISSTEDLNNLIKRSNSTTTQTFKKEVERRLNYLSDNSTPENEINTPQKACIQGTFSF